MFVAKAEVDALSRGADCPYEPRAHHAPSVSFVGYAHFIGHTYYFRYVGYARVALSQK